MFVVDNSGSMSEEQAGFVNNVDAFVGSLNAVGIDYRIGVLTTDMSAFVGDVVTNTTVDGAAVLSDQVDALGTQGSGTERGLEMLYDCTHSGSDCSAAAGFLRDDALFEGIIVSDEPDQSALAPDDYVDYFRTLKSDSDLFRVDAIAGEFPTVGCATGASPGYGYVDAVELTGGTFLSVCGDWNESLSLLGTSAMRSSAWRFPLTAAPFVDTLEVSVDGAPADPKTWTYVEQSGADAVPAIEFDRFTLPPPGALVEVRYDEPVTCE